jgi:hypothetical protein
MRGAVFWILFSLGGEVTARGCAEYTTCGECLATTTAAGESTCGWCGQHGGSSGGTCFSGTAAVATTCTEQGSTFGCAIVSESKPSGQSCTAIANPWEAAAFCKDMYANLPPAMAGVAAKSVALAPASVTATNCTGHSKKLPADQCNAWIEFHDATGLQDCSRTDPCDLDACSTYNDDSAAKSAAICNTAGTAVVQM